MIRRLIVLSALSVIAFAPAAYAGHGEELDGCDHGATSVPCRPDPSPNGQDCDVHGNHGGVNEDHCATTTTTTATPDSTTTSTAPPATVTTTTSPTTPTTEAVPSSATTTTSAASSPETGGLRHIESDPATWTELPRTGFGSTLLVFLGLWFLLGGAVSLLAGAWLGR